MVIGIDFGTSNTSTAIYDGNRVVFIPLDPFNPEDINVLSSMLYISNKREQLFGYRAMLEYQEKMSGRVFHLEKQYYGAHSMYFADKTVTIDGYVLEYKDIPGRLFQYLKKYLGTDIITSVFGIEYKPYQLISYILKYIKSKAEAYLEQEIDSVLIGRPVKFSGNEDFNQNAEKFLGFACKLAGFKHFEFQYEPVAAAFSYSLEAKDNESVLIFDFGGGTFDVSVVNFQNKIARILAIGGVPIGGYDFDKDIMYEKIAPYFGRGCRNKKDNTLLLSDAFYKGIENWQAIVNLNKNIMFLKRLRNLRRNANNSEPFEALECLVKENHGFAVFQEIEKVKKELSSSSKTVFKYDKDAIEIHEQITQKEFDNILLQYSNRIFDAVDDVLKSANLKYTDISHVIRVGGSSRIPFFYQQLLKRFDKNKVRMKDELKNVVAGLAVEAYYK